MIDLETTYREGIAAFDAGAFYESHEFFEECYNEAEPSEDQFFRALLEIAGAFHILTARQRRHGALEKIARAAERLAHFAPVHRGIDVSSLLDSLERWQQALASASARGDPPPPRLMP